MKRLLALWVLMMPGCSTLPPREYPPGPCSAGPVILVHGLWPDNETWWMRDVEERLQRSGIEAVCVPYRSFVIGYLFGYGTDGPADRIAAFVKELEDRHARTSCPALLRCSAIGYSAGTVVLQKVVERGVSLNRAYFAGSPLPFWTKKPDSVRVLVNYHSLTDGLVWPLLGAGAFGMSGADANRRHWRHHLMPLWRDREEVERIVLELLLAADGPPHSCFRDPQFLDWYRGAKSMLRSGE